MVPIQPIADVKVTESNNRSLEEWINYKPNTSDRKVYLNSLIIKYFHLLKSILGA